MSQEKLTAEEVLQNATLLCKGTRLNKDGSEYKIMIKAMEEYATLKLQEKITETNKAWSVQCAEWMIKCEEQAKEIERLKGENDNNEEHF